MERIFPGVYDSAHSAEDGLEKIKNNYYDLILGKKLALNILKDSPLQLKDIKCCC